MYLIFMNWLKKCARKTIGKVKFKITEKNPSFDCESITLSKIAKLFPSLTITAEPGKKLGCNL